MNKLVTVRDLRNRGGAVLDEVARSGAVIVTRDGVAVAQLMPLPRPPLGARELIRRRQALPDIDPMVMRAELDELLDPAL